MSKFIFYFFCCNICQADPICNLIKIYSDEFQIDSEIIEAIVFVESSFISRDGDRGKSKGLMQVQLGAARDVGFKGNKISLDEPSINIKYGVKYLADLISKTKNIYKALDAYNRGYGNVLKYPYKKYWVDHPYVGKILSYLDWEEKKCRLLQKKWPVTKLMNGINVIQKLQFGII